MTNIFKNYQNQKIKSKELIIILNNNKLKRDEWKNYAKHYRNVSVYQMDESISLGACLNLGVDKAKYGIIAKFDDDDYYGKNYLKTSVKEFDRENVSILGKRTYYVYLEGKNQLLLVTPRYENKLVNQIAGASLIVKKDVFKRVSFKHLDVGEDSDFIERCKKEGYKLYSTSRHYFAVIRRKDFQSHTWKISDEKFIRRSIAVTFSGDFKDIVDNKQYMS